MCIYFHCSVSCITMMYIYICVCKLCFMEAHMEDWETKCVASLNKDFTYLLLTYLLRECFTLNPYPANSESEETLPQV